MKRLFDFVVSSLLCILMFIPFVVVAVLVKLNFGSPIIFKQERSGLYGKSFYIYKFRTMTNKKDESGNLLPDDVRLTRFGKLLRKLSLDELPQLINVIKGDVSLVGPRPLLMEYLELYTAEQNRRHQVRPGITGWAQINGRNSISWEEKFELDVWYVDNHSFWLDIKIILITVVKVFKSEDISQQGHVTMHKFRGTDSNKEVMK
ncbi:TPA: sugar transferase [Bacillus cereus]